MTLNHQVHRALTGFGIFIPVYTLFLEEKSRWILWSPVAVGLGIAGYYLLPFEPVVWPAALVIAGLLVFLWLLRHSPYVWPPIAAIVLLSLGFLAAGIKTELAATPILQKRLNGNFEARVCRVEHRHDRQRLILDQIQFQRLDRAEIPSRIRISLRGKTRLAAAAPGQRLRVRAALFPPPEPIVPGGFDFARHLNFQGIGGVGFAYARPEVVGRSELGMFSGCGGWFAAIRVRIIAAIKQADLGPAEAMTIALMTGERGELPEIVLENLRAAGLAHLLAISGLHVGLIASSIFFLLRLMLAACPPLALRYPIKKWAALAAILAAGAYMLLTGATIPTQRAFLMLAVFLGAILLDRAAISMRGVMLAALLILITAPHSLLSASFQLSFAAVVALVAVYEAVREPFSRLRARAGLPRRLLAYLAGVALTTLVAGGATSLFAIQHFNQMAAYSLVGNMIAVPLMAVLVMPAAVIAYGLMPLGLAAPVLGLMAWGIEVILWLAAEVARQPGAVIGVPTPNFYFLPLITLAGLWLCLWRRRWRLWALPVIVFAVASLIWLQPEKPLAVVNETGRAVAIWDENRRMFIHGTRPGSLTQKRWRRHWDGDLGAEPLQRRHPKVTCDRLGCILTRTDIIVAYVKDPRGLREDCAKADIVIAAIPAGRRCQPRLGVIDFFDLWRHGAHAIYLLNGKARIETVRQKQGKWPWARRRKPK